MPSLTSANIAALNEANDNLAPSPFYRHGSRSSPSDSSTASSFSNRFHSLRDLRSQWVDEAWRYTTDRIERIYVGKVAPGSRVLTTQEMENEFPEIPEVKRGFADCLPVASPGGAAFVGWRVKGATFPKTMNV